MSTSSWCGPQGARHRRRGLHRQHAGRPAARAGRRGARATCTTSPTASGAGSPAARTTSTSRRATCATRGRVRDAVEGCDVVFHLAALIGIPYSYVAPESYVQTNVMGTYNVADACRRARRAAAWCTPRRARPTAPRITVPIDEDHPLQPQSPYSASKIGADMMALSLPARVRRCRWRWCRPFNTYGPRQSARAVIPTILTPAARRGEGDPARRRPRRRATSTTSTTPRAASSPSPTATGRSGNVVNIGSGREISIGDLGAAADRDHRAATPRSSTDDDRVCAPTAARSSACSATTRGRASGRAGSRRSRSRRACSGRRTGCGTTSPGWRPRATRSDRWTPG